MLVCTWKGVGTTIQGTSVVMNSSCCLSVSSTRDLDITLEVDLALSRPIMPRILLVVMGLS